jgi:hypothetical protein
VEIVVHHPSARVPDFAGDALARLDPQSLNVFKNSDADPHLHCRFTGIAQEKIPVTGADQKCGMPDNGIQQILKL